MKSTHIGSLPYIKIDKVISFNRKLDLPTLSTLPNLSSNELMLNQFVLGIKKAKLKDYQIEVNAIDFVDDFELSFLCYQDFREEFSLQEVKFHLCGPITFLSSFIKKLTSNEVETLMDWYVERVRKIYLKIDQDFKKAYLCLDEPKLYLYSEYSHVLEKIITKLSGINLGIHFCCKVDLLSIDFSKFNFISFDLSLYSSEEIKSFSYSGTIIFGVIDYKGQIIKNFDLVPKDALISPSCGLGLCSLEEADRFLLNLENLTHLDHQI